MPIRQEAEAVSFTQNQNQDQKQALVVEQPPSREDLYKYPSPSISLQLILNSTWLGWHYLEKHILVETRKARSRTLVSLLSLWVYFLVCVELVDERVEGR
jgi:hypothetical protein